MSRNYTTVALVFMAAVMVMVTAGCGRQPESLLALRDVQSYYAERPLPHDWQMHSVVLKDGQIHVQVVDRSPLQVEYILSMPVMRRFRYLHGVCPVGASVWRNFVNKKKLAVVLLGPDDRPVETAHCRDLT